MSNPKKITCWRCGVKFYLRSEFKPGTPCVDCRHSIEEVDGPQPWKKKEK